jgi:hypothetical protein
MKIELRALRLASLPVAEHSSFKRPGGRRVTGLRRSEVLGFGDHDVAQCCFGRPLSVPRFAGGHVLRVDPDCDGTALTRRATPPRLRYGVAAWCEVFVTSCVVQGAAQGAKSCPAWRARPLGGGCGSSPRWVRIFSITGRSRIAAMILSSAPPQLGQCSMSMSKAKLQRRLTCTQVMS